MKFGIFAVVLAVLVSLSFAQSFSNPIPMAGTLDLTFMDLNEKPMANAIVEYTYIVSGTGYTTDTPMTGTGTTDANGRFVTTLTADARQTIPFKINLTYQGIQVLHDESSSWLTYADKPAVIIVEVGALTIEVKDPKGRPLAGVSLEISGGRGSESGISTDGSGEYAISSAEPGAEYTVVARYGNSEVERKSRAPAKMELTMPAYDFTVRSVDDRGNRLEAGLSANITALDKKVIGSGELALKQVPMGDIYVTARYGKALIEKRFTVTADAEERMIMDLNAPVVSGMVIDPQQPGEGEVTVAAPVDDGADGAGVSSVVLKYRVGSGEEMAVAMVKEGSTYSAAIPRQPAGSVVTYYIEATDRNGNRIESEPANYIVKAGAGTGGTGSRGSAGESGGWTGWLLPAAGVVGIVAMAAFIFLKRRKAGAAPPAAG